MSINGLHLITGFLHLFVTIESIETFCDASGDGITSDERLFNENNGSKVSKDTNFESNFCDFEIKLGSDEKK